MRRRRRVRTWSHQAERTSDVFPETPRNELPDFIREALDWSMSLSGARRVLLWRVDLPHGLVRVYAGAGGSAPNPHVLHGSPITWTVRERTPARLEPAPTWAVSKRVIAVPVLEQVPQHALTLELADDIEVQAHQFDALGIYLGAILNVVRDHEILDEHQARTQHLIDALRVLPLVSTTDALARELVLAAQHIANAAGAAVASWDGTRGIVLHCEGGAQSGAEFQGVESLAAMAARGSVTISREASALRGTPIVARKERHAFTPDAAVAIPLVTHGNVVGVLVLWSVDRIAEAAITALETIAPYGAAQLEHARELGAMRTRAERDALTGLHNRGAFDQVLSAEIARFDRYHRPFALIMMDIDHFKQVNDQFGHDAGDAVLRHISRIITASLRDVDTAARYGGEEFALLLLETDKAHAVEIAERIRVRIEQTPVAWQGRSIVITSSAGVAAIPARDTDPASVVRVADQLLYEAKRAGRNRVVHAR